MSHRIASLMIGVAYLSRIFVIFVSLSEAFGQVTITEFNVPTAGSQPLWIASGPDGNLWFTETSANKIGRITTGGIITEFVVPTRSSSPAGIVAGPDNNLWFVEGTG